MNITAPAYGEKLLVYTAALLLSVATGAFVASADLVWILAVIGVLAAAALVASREATLWFVIITGLVLAGVAQMYLPGAKYFRYLPALASAGLMLHVASEWLAHPRREVPSTVPAFLSFALLGLLAMAAHWQGFGMAVVGLKSYYPMWTLFLGLALIRWRPQVIDSLPRAALWLALLQLPFVVHQFLFLVPMRQGLNEAGLVAVDIVAGTFGGDIFGGGANAVLSVFLIMVSACLLGMWRQGAVSGFKALTGVLLLLAPVALNSSKVALVYLPIVFGMLFFTDMLRRPLRAMAGLLVAAGLLVGMLAAFTALNQAPGTDTWRDLVVQTYENQLATERERADNYSGLSRWTVLTFWAEQHQHAGFVETLIGHGPGATRVQDEGLDLAHTLAERRYGGRQIGYTAVAALLWEVGVLGLLTVLAIFYLGYRQATFLARYYEGLDAKKSGIAHGLRAALVVLALSLAHKDFFAFHIPYQTLVAAVFGYLAAQMNLVRQAERQAVQPPAPRPPIVVGSYVHE